MRNALRASLLLAALPTFGFTNCEHFEDVTVPAADTRPPVAGTRYLDNDGGDAIRFDGFHETVTDVDKNYFIVPWGFDAGGVREIRGSRSATRYCSSGGIGTITYYDYLTDVDSQPGGPGDVRSNGRYLYWRFFPRDFTSGDCEVHMGWTIQVTDYQGNVTAASGSISYEP